VTNRESWSSPSRAGRSAAAPASRLAHEASNVTPGVDPRIWPHADPNRHRFATPGSNLRSRAARSRPPSPTPCNRKVGGSSPPVGSPDLAVDLRICLFLCVASLLRARIGDQAETTRTAVRPGRRAGNTRSGRLRRLAGHLHEDA
jgi:hypothetical protein